MLLFLLRIYEENQYKLRRLFYFNIFYTIWKNQLRGFLRSVLVVDFYNILIRPAVFRNYKV